MPTILVLDDHPLIVNGMRAMLKKTIYNHIIASKNTIEASFVLEKHKIDLIFMDLHLPNEDIFTFYQTIKTDYKHIKIIILTSNEDGHTIRLFIEAGVDGYLLKNADRTEIIDAIYTVLNGNSYLSKIVSQNLVSALGKSAIDKITSREQDILCCLEQGMTSEQISQKLFIAILTVDTHRRNLMRKFEVHNITSLLNAVKKRVTTQLLSQIS